MLKILIKLSFKFCMTTIFFGLVGFGLNYIGLLPSFCVLACFCFKTSLIRFDRSNFFVSQVVQSSASPLCEKLEVAPRSQGSPVYRENKSVIMLSVVTK